MKQGLGTRTKYVTNPMARRPVAHRLVHDHRGRVTRCGKPVRGWWLHATASSWVSVPCQDCYRYDQADKAARPRARKAPVSGVCRVCGCTDLEACDGGCSWVDAAHTLCSECEPARTVPPVRDQRAMARADKELRQGRARGVRA